MINLRKKGPVTEHIEKFQKLSLRVEGLADDQLLDLFMGTLKDTIQHEVCLFEPTSLKKDFMVARKVESKNLVMATRRATPNTSKESHVPSINTPQPTRLTPQKLEERRANIYSLIVIESIVRYISVVRRSYSIYTLKGKKQRIKNHLKLKKQRRLLNKRLLPLYLVMHWLEFALLKLSRLKDI